MANRSASVVQNSDRAWVVTLTDTGLSVWHRNITSDEAWMDWGIELCARTAQLMEQAHHRAQVAGEITQQA